MNVLLKTGASAIMLVGFSTVALAAENTKKPPATAPAIPAVAVDPARHTQGLSLVKLFYPRDAIIAQAKRFAEDQIPQALAAQAEIAPLEKAYPGLVKAMMTAAIPTLMTMLDNRFPDLWANITDVYATSMTPVELSQNIAFYSSPLGVKLVRQTLESDTGKGMMDSLTLSSLDNIQVSHASAMQDERTARAQAMARMSPEEIRQILTFMTSPAGRVKTKLQPEADRLMLHWMDAKPSPEEDEMGKALMIQAAADFIAKANERTASDPPHK
jgi:hypothetical protein